MQTGQRIQRTNQVKDQEKSKAQCVIFFFLQDFVTNECSLRVYLLLFKESGSELEVEWQRLS